MGKHVDQEMSELLVVPHQDERPDATTACLHPVAEHRG